METVVLNGSTNHPTLVVNTKKKPGPKPKAQPEPVQAKPRGRKPGSKNKPKASPAPQPKQPQSFVPAAGLGSVLEVMAWAEAKYKGKPWQSRQEPSTTHVAKAIGHIGAWLAGRKTDEESGLSSLAHAAARLLIALSL